MISSTFVTGSIDTAVLIIILSSSLFLSSYDKTIIDNSERISDLYNTLDIVCTVQPRVGNSLIPISIGNSIMHEEFISNPYITMISPMNYRVFSESETDETQSFIGIILGTSDSSRYLQNQDAVLSNKEILLKKGQCLMKSQVMDKIGADVGDYIDVQGKNTLWEDNPVASWIRLEIVGVYTCYSTEDIICNVAHLTGKNGLIIGEVAEGEWAKYNDFSFHIDQQYNREYEEMIKPKLISLCGNDWVLVAHDKDYFDVIKPLEENVDNNKLFLKILSSLTLLLTIMIRYVFLKRYRTDICIKKCLGESKSTLYIQYNCLFFITHCLACGVLYVCMKMMGANNLRFLFTVCLSSIFISFIIVNRWINQGLLNMLEKGV